MLQFMYKYKIYTKTYVSGNFFCLSVGVCVQETGGETEKELKCVERGQHHCLL